MGESVYTPSNWQAFNMVHAERGGPMTPEEIGEYVANNVRKSLELGGSAERFLFVSEGGEGSPDICLVGNGPRGPQHAALIASAPDLLAVLKRAQEELRLIRMKDTGAVYDTTLRFDITLALTKAEGRQ